MHPEAYRAVSRMAHQHGLDRHHRNVLTTKGLDIGGADVNGSARELLSVVRTWDGVDIAPGPGVDIVADMTQDFSTGPLGHLPGFYDVVLCTEVLEHVQDWPALVRNAAKALREGGLLILTCAGRGRRPHGARGAKDPAPGEYYGNVDDAALLGVLGQVFSESSLTYNPNPGDLYAWARA